MPTPIILMSIRVPVDMALDIDLAARAMGTSKNKWVVLAIKNELKREVGE